MKQWEVTEPRPRREEEAECKQTAEFGSKQVSESKQRAVPGAQMKQFVRRKGKRELEKQKKSRIQTELKRGVRGNGEEGSGDGDGERKAGASRSDGGHKTKARKPDEKATCFPYVRGPRSLHKELHGNTVGNTIGYLLGNQESIRGCHTFSEVGEWRMTKKRIQ